MKNLLMAIAAFFGFGYANAQKARKPAQKPKTTTATKTAKTTTSNASVTATKTAKKTVVAKAPKIVKTNAIKANQASNTKNTAKVKITKT